MYDVAVDDYGDVVGNDGSLVNQEGHCCEQAFDGCLGVEVFIKAVYDALAEEIHGVGSHPVCSAVGILDIRVELAEPCASLSLGFRVWCHSSEGVDAGAQRPNDGSVGVSQSVTLALGGELLCRGDVSRQGRANMEFS